MKTILALDLSINGTGIAVMQGKTILHREVLKLKHIRDFRRVARIHRRISACIKYFKPEVVFIEGYAYGYKPSQARGFSNLAELGGVIRFLLYQNGLKWFEVAPKAHKRFITGSGKATKELERDIINKLLKSNIEDLNESDAVGVGLYGICMILKEEL